MYGNQHLLLSFFSVTFLIMPLLIFTGDLTLITLPLAVGFGSLMPDIDANDSAIKHPTIGGMGRFLGRYAKSFSNFFGALNVLLAPITEYLIYKPYCLLINEEQRHRGAFHSFYAAIFTSIVLTVLMSLLLLYVEAFSLTFVLLVGGGVFLGFTLHLVEDACTHDGVDFLAPFQSFHIKGKHRTRDDNQFLPDIQIWTLIILTFIPHAFWFLSQDSINILPVIPFYIQQVAVFIILVGIWIIFLKLHKVRKA